MSTSFLLWSYVEKIDSDLKRCLVLQTSWFWFKKYNFKNLLFDTRKHMTVIK